MTSPFTLWSRIADVFETNAGPLDGDDWSAGNVTDGGYPIWVANWTPASNYSTTVASTYTIQLTSEDWVASVQPMITIATATLINPFLPTNPGGGNLGTAMVFTGDSTVGNGGVVYWTGSTATPGDYDLDFQALSTNYVSAPSTGPNTTLTGSAETLISSVAAPTGWNVNWGTSDFVFAYSTAATASTENIWLQAFTSAGVAETADVEAFSGVSDATVYSVGYSASTSTYYLDYTLVDGNQTGWYHESFDTATGVLGAPTKTLSLKTYSSFYGLSSRTLFNGNHIRMVSGLIGRRQVLQVFFGAALTDTIDLAGVPADHWASAGVYDPATAKSDYTALIYSEGKKVYLDFLNASGVEIGSPELVPGLTSFDRLHEMGNGTRVEIDYTYTDPQGGDQIGALIYDTASTAYHNTLSTGGGQYIGTPFNDIYRVASTTTGDYFIDGGGGLDSLRVGAAANAVQFTMGADGFIDVVTAGASVTLEGFSSILLNNETIGLAGTAGAPKIELPKGGLLQLEDPLSSDYTIGFAIGGGHVTLESGVDLGASLATWRSGDSVVFEALGYDTNDSLKFVSNLNHSGGLLELVNSSDTEIAALFKVSSGALATNDFAWSVSGTGSQVKFI